MQQKVEMDVIDRIKEELEKNDNVIFALVFGSYSTGRQKKQSDIDIAVYLKKIPDVDTFLKLISKLADVVHKDVDVIILNTASVFMRHQVFKYGIPIVIKNLSKYIRFREKNMDDYEEYNYISGMNLYD